ncbi:hypothetical protein DFH09DRAFT_1375627 [Mycena vulgaris]|nr:hypothetical protein DFH09DRAFT_1375627 [Mycena vulgaris]
MPLAHTAPPSPPALPPLPFAAPLAAPPLPLPQEGLSGVSPFVCAHGASHSSKSLQGTLDSVMSEPRLPAFTRDDLRDYRSLQNRLVTLAQPCPQTADRWLFTAIKRVFRYHYHPASPRIRPATSFAHLVPGRLLQLPAAISRLMAFRILRGLNGYYGLCRGAPAPIYSVVLHYFCTLPHWAAPARSALGFRSAGYQVTTRPSPPCSVAMREHRAFYAATMASSIFGTLAHCTALCAPFTLQYPRHKYSAHRRHLLVPVLPAVRPLVCDTAWAQPAVSRPATFTPPLCPSNVHPVVLCDSSPCVRAVSDVFGSSDFQSDIHTLP